MLYEVITPGDLLHGFDFGTHDVGTPLPEQVGDDVDLFAIEDLKNIWEAGNLLHQRDADTRTIFTLDSSTTPPSKLPFTTSNASSLQTSLQASSSVEASAIISYVRGKDDVNNDNVIDFRKRTVEIGTRSSRITSYNVCYTKLLRTDGKRSTDISDLGGFPCDADPKDHFGLVLLGRRSGEMARRSSCDAAGGPVVSYNFV